MDGSKNPIVENTPYVFVAKLDYYSNSGNTMVMIPGTATIEGVQIDAPAWGAMPEVLDETVQYVFEKADVATENEAEAGNYYYIKNVGNSKYIKCSESGVYFVDEKDGNHFFVNNVAGATWAFTRPGTNQAIHQNNHGGGQGTGSNLVYWAQDTDASQWYIMSVENATSIEDVIVAEGDDVVSVAYYTASGAALPAPAKGINVVVVVYANGVVETKKVLVK